MSSKTALGLFGLLGAFALATSTRDASAAGKNGFYAVAHMTNTIEAVRWALGQGANAVEMDLRFEENGHPLYFKHQKPCDCSCPQNWVTSSRHICKHMGCNSSEDPRAMFNFLAKQ